MILGIGIGDDPSKVFRSVRKVKGRYHVRYYCRDGTDIPKTPNTSLKRSTAPERALIADLMSGEIGGAVRGTLHANETLRELKSQTGVDHLERIALLETATGKKFFLAPVGIDEGWTVEQKLSLIRKGQNIARSFGMNEKVGILSGGRFGDVGRHKVIDRSIADAELVARIAKIDHYEILIEEAIRECSVIIAPDGISGNLIFRTLIFLGKGRGHGAPVVNIDKIFVDTSRASPDYTNALLLAATLAKNSKRSFKNDK